MLQDAWQVQRAPRHRRTELVFCFSEASIWHAQTYIRLGDIDSTWRTGFAVITYDCWGYAC
jgi:hypothetical protein